MNGSHTIVFRVYDISVIAFRIKSNKWIRVVSYGKLYRIRFCEFYNSYITGEVNGIFLRKEFKTILASVLVKIRRT